MKHFAIFAARVTLLLFSSSVLASAADADQGKSVYLIGNSLTWDTVPANLDGDVQWHVDCGKPLPYIFANPEKPCVKSSTLWPQALKDKQYDVIAVQSHYGATLTEDATVISEWMSMQPKAEFVIHTGWPRSVSQAEEWASQEKAGKMTHSLAYIDALVELLKQQNPGRVVSRTKAMDALQWVVEDIKAGKAPFDELAFLYRDAIHMNTQTGRYMMHNLMRHAVGQKASLAGFEKIEPEIKDYLDGLLEKAGVQPVALPAGAQSSKAITVVYVSESKENRVVFFKLDEKNGDLDRMGEVNLSGAPGCLAPSRDGKMLYAAVRSSSEFATLSIDPGSGGLSLVSTAPASGSAAYIWPDSTGKWLLAAYYGEGRVSSSAIVGGGIKGEPVSVLDVGPKAHCIQTDPANRFAFAPHPVDLNRVDQFVFDANSGKLSSNDPAFASGADGAGPRHLQFHPNGKWVYLVNEQGKSVSLCHYDGEKGTLKLRQTWSTHPDDWDMTKGSCADIEITAGGRFLYASNRGHDSIAAFSIDEKSGELTSLGQTPTGETPRSFNLMPVENQRLLVAAGQKSNTLTVYRRNPSTGVLTQLKVIECGGSPAWVQGVRLEK
jgi:6-phosphogluconolactonase